MDKNTFSGENMTEVMFLSFPSPLSENVASSNSICISSEVMHCYTCTPDEEGAAKGLLRQN